jgi:hypothetical protein
MRTLTYTNPNGISIVLGNETYGITSLTGIETPGLTNQEQKSPYQDGTTPIDQLFNTREISLSGIICSGVLTTIASLRRTLLMALNPKLGPGIITLTTDAGTFEISGRPDEIRFANKNANTHAQTFQVVFYCHDPYFRDVNDTTVTLDTTTVSESLITVIGDVSSPFSVSISGIGVGAKLIETLRNLFIEYSAYSDQKIALDTSYGNKTVLQQYYTLFSLAAIWGYGSILVYSEKLGVWIRYVGLRLASSGDGQTWNYLFPINAYPLVDYDCLEWFKNINAFLSFVEDGAAHLVIGKSTNGIDFSACTMSGPSLPSAAGSVMPTKIKYIEATHRFVATVQVYSSSSWHFYIITSSDGNTWTVVDTGLVFYAYDIDYLVSAGLYIIGGGINYNTGHLIYTSPDLTTFTSRSNSATSPIKLVFSDPNIDRILMDTLSTTDGISYSAYAPGAITKMMYNPKNSLYIGFGGSYIRTSPDGTTWTTRYTETTTSINSLRWSAPDNLFLAITGKGGVLKSIDAITWTQLINHTVSDSNATLPDCDIIFSSLLNKWVGIGAETSWASVDAYALNFKQGSVVSGFTDLLCPVDGLNISRLVCVLNGTCYGSTDGLAWTSLSTVPNGSSNTLAYNMDLDLYCSIGPTGIVAISADCVTWRTSRTIGDYFIRKIVYIQERKRFYAIGNPTVAGAGKRAALFVSSDGAEWTNIAPSVLLDATIINIAYSKAQNRIVILVPGGTAYTGAGVYASVDDINWSERKVSGFIYPGARPGIVYSDLLNKWIVGQMHVNDSDLTYTYYSDDGYVFTEPSDYSLITNGIGGGFENTDLGILVLTAQNLVLRLNSISGDNVIENIAEGSTFFSLTPGQNKVALRCPRGAFKAVLKYRNRYLGV